MEGTMPRDKLYHAAAGAIVALAAYLLSGSPAFASLALIAAAIGKEVWDSLGHGTRDAWDAIWTIAGGAPVIFAALTL
jgi:hypothetical protein